MAFAAGGRVVERSGKDLREVDLLVGSGGVLRNNAADVAARVLGSVTGDDVPGGWQLPRAPAHGRRPRLRAGRRPGLLAAEPTRAARARACSARLR